MRFIGDIVQEKKVDTIQRVLVSITRLKNVRCGDMAKLKTIYGCRNTIADLKLLSQSSQMVVDGVG